MHQFLTHDGPIVVYEPLNSRLWRHMGAADHLRRWKVQQLKLSPCSLHLNPIPGPCSMLINFPSSRPSEDKKADNHGPTVSVPPLCSLSRSRTHHRPFIMLPRLGWSLSLIATTLVGLAKAAPLDAGTTPFSYGGETFNTYYQVFGREGGTKTPLIVLHGGPGLSYDYLQSLRDLTGRPILFYDQIGGGRSTHLQDKPNSFWTVDLFVKQLEGLIAHFCLKEFDVLGHSWGGMLASEFAVTKPSGLKKLILSNTPASTQLWGQSQVNLISKFPTQVEQSLMKGWSDPDHKEALIQYFSVHGSTVDPWPQDLTTSFNFLFADPTADVKMWYVIVDAFHFLRALK